MSRPRTVVGTTTTTSSSRVSPGLARLAGAVAVDPMARRLMLLHLADTSPWSAGPLLRNATLAPLFAAVDRCAYACDGWFPLQ